MWLQTLPIIWRGSIYPYPNAQELVPMLSELAKKVRHATKPKTCIGLIISITPDYLSPDEWMNHTSWQNDVIHLGIIYQTDIWEAYLQAHLQWKEENHEIHFFNIPLPLYIHNEKAK